MTHDLIFLHGSRIPHCTAVVDKHFDGYHTLQLMTRGRLDLWYDDQHFTLRSPVVWPAYPGPQIRFHLASGCASWSHRYIAFRGPAVSRWRAAGLLLTAPQQVRNPHTLIQRFDNLLTQFRRTDSLGQRLASNTLEGILLSLADQRGPARHPSSNTWLNPILTQLEISIGHAVIDYERLADQHSMSLSTLRRRFRAATGSPIHTHMLQLRIGRARQLLGDTDLSIKQIADQLGFRDVFYFSRQFRQITGVPPAAFRKSRQH